MSIPSFKPEREPDGFVEYKGHRVPVFYPKPEDAERHAAAAEVRRTRTIHGLRMRYAPRFRSYFLSLSNGITVRFPLGLLSEADRGRLTLEPGGEGISDDERDLHFDLSYVLARLMLGPVRAERMLALERGSAAGVRAKSEAKTAAAQANGKKGGRPRKQPLPRVTGG